MTNEIDTKHTRLFKSLQYLRLKYSLYLLNEDLKKNQPIAADSNSGRIGRLFLEPKNNLRSTKTNKLLALRSSINSEIGRLLKDSTEMPYDQNEINQIIREVFQNDTYSLEKSLFSAGIVLDGEYNYEYEKETLDYISALLWNNNYQLSYIKNSIEHTYKDLAKQPLSIKQKWLLGGTAAAVLFTIAIPGLNLAGLSASGITSGLAGFGTALGLGGTMLEGIELMFLFELLVDSAIIGFTYAMLDEYNKNIVKNSFRKMDYNDAAKMLAIKCYIMSVAKQTMPENIFKEKTSELLQMIQDLKSDTDYVLLVEKQNIEENKKKIKVFHNLDEKLAKIFC